MSKHPQGCLTGVGCPALNETTRFTTTMGELIMAEATEVQYSEKHGSVVRVSDPLLAYEIAQELHDHKEATEYWVAQADQARLKAADLSDELRSLGEQTDDGKIADETVAHSLALEVNNLRNEAEFLRGSYKSVRAQVDEFGDKARKISREFDAFKVRVRDAAILVREENDWCLDGLNSVLEDLGLPTYSPKKYVEYKIRLLVEGIDNDDDAESIARSLLEGIYDSDEVSVEEIDHHRTWDADES